MSDNGKTAIVTGASRGIGAAVAERLGERRLRRRGELRGSAAKPKPT